VGGSGANEGRGGDVAAPSLKRRRACRATAIRPGSDASGLQERREGVRRAGGRRGATPSTADRHSPPLRARSRPCSSLGRIPREYSMHMDGRSEMRIVIVAILVTLGSSAVADESPFRMPVFSAPHPEHWKFEWKNDSGFGPRFRGGPRNPRAPRRAPEPSDPGTRRRRNGRNASWSCSGPRGPTASRCRRAARRLRAIGSRTSPSSP